jgi:hypothetical protein
MSGFLQRLASGVLHAQRAIHPAVESIWSAPGISAPGKMPAPGAAEPIEFSSEVLTPPPPRRVDTPGPPGTQTPGQLHSIPHAQPEGSNPASDRAVDSRAQLPAIARTVIAEGVPFQPLVVPPQRKGVSTLPPEQQANEATQPSEVNLHPLIHASPPEHSGLKQQQSVETARSLVPAPRIPAPPRSPGAQAPSFRSPSQRPAQSAQSLREEPDAIEIHIGRIEVLAAPPRPAQPAATKPARKSLDLGEYLRRDRRPR